MRQKTVITNLLQRVREVYYKVHQVLQSMAEVYYKVIQVLQSVTDRYFKVHQVLQSVTTLLKSASGITKGNSYCRVKRNTFCGIYISDRTVKLRIFWDKIL